MHAEFFDHDAVIVDLALAVRWDVVKEHEAAVRMRAVARGRAARQGRYTLMIRVVWEPRVEVRVWDLDARSCFGQYEYPPVCPWRSRRGSTGDFHTNWLTFYLLFVFLFLF